MILGWRKRHARYRRAIFRAIAREGTTVVWNADAAPRAFQIGVLIHFLGEEIKALSHEDVPSARALLGDAHDHLDTVRWAIKKREADRRPFVVAPPPRPYVPSESEYQREMTAQAWRDRCVVYFVQQVTPGADGPIKIGVTGQLQKRMRALRTGVPHDLRLLATMPGDDTAEHGLHQRFADDRISPRAEWFRPSPTLLAFIATLAPESEIEAAQ
jgi:hypothetical protein